MFDSPRVRDLHGALVVFCCGLAVTALTAYTLSAVERERDRLEFEKNVAAARDAIFDRVDTSVALLRGVAGLIAANDDRIGADAFRRYIGQLSLREVYPGVLGIGWSRRLEPREVRPFVERMRGEGIAGFSVWPHHERAEYHTIVYLEPLDARNQAAIGYDMYTDPVRAEAMARARDTGAPAATARVQLVQEISADKQPGFLIYLPVYRGAAIPPSVEARRRALMGFVYVPLRAGDFLSQAYAHELRPSLSVSVYDSANRDTSALLYARNAGPRNVRHAQFVQTAELEVAGRKWMLQFESAKRTASSWLTVAAAGLAGLVLSLLLALITAREARATALVARSLARERAARNDAERASQLKDDFLATLSHELRTPLNAILGWAHVVKSGKASAEQMRTGLDAIERNAKAQVRLIDELLDMSRIVSGKLQLDMQAVDLGQLVAASVQSAMPAAQQKSLRVEQQLDRVPSVRGDPARLQQVIGNLLANAVKFTPEGGLITVRLEHAGGNAALTVIDTGIGIERSFLPHVFERFRQADASRTRRYGGLGLGLSIVRQLVELHGGTASAHSAGRGMGATFIVTLPCEHGEARRPDAPAAAAPVSEAAHAPETRDFAGVRILVVDDEQDARDLLRRLLEEHGAEVRVEDSASRALSIVAAFAPDLLLSDIGMPGMDGYELIRRVRSMAGVDVYAIAISAYASPEDSTRALEAGYDAYLVKPLHPASLLRTVSHFVARARRDGTATPFAARRA